MKPFTFKIGGEAGFGVTSAGISFSKIVARSGYHVFNYMEYPSLIRGGHNVAGCFISDKPIGAPYEHTNFLVAFNQDAINLHKKELTIVAIILQ